MNKLTGMLLYASVNEPVKGFKDPLKPDVDPGMQWECSVAVFDDNVVNKFKKYVQSVKSKVSLKTVEKSEFEERYRVEPPDDAPEWINVFQFKRKTTLGTTGKQVPEEYRPRVLEQTVSAKGVISRIDITYDKDKQIGNGSMGVVSIQPWTISQGTWKGTTVLQLKNVLVTDLIPFAREEREDSEPGSEFDDEDAEEVAPEPAKAVSKAPVKSVSKVTKPVSKAPPEDEFLDDIPF